MSDSREERNRVRPSIDTADLKTAIRRSRLRTRGILESYHFRGIATRSRVWAIESRLNVIRSENIQLRSRIDDLQIMINDIKDKLTSGCEHIMPREKVIMVREIAFDEAYALVREYIRERDLIDPLDLADDLRIPYGQAHEIMLRLESEGLVEPDD